MGCVRPMWMRRALCLSILLSPGYMKYAPRQCTSAGQLTIMQSMTYLLIANHYTR